MERDTGCLRDGPLGRELGAPQRGPQLRVRNAVTLRDPGQKAVSRLPNSGEDVCFVHVAYPIGGLGGHLLTLSVTKDTVPLFLDIRKQHVETFGR